VPQITRFVHTMPGGPLVYADSDGTIDVQMTDRFGRPWFMYRAREGYQADADEARKLRHSGLRSALRHCRRCRRAV